MCSDVIVTSMPSAVASEQIKPIFFSRAKETTVDFFVNDDLEWKGIQAIGGIFLEIERRIQSVSD